MTILMNMSKIYKPVSVRAAKFFYLITDLVKLNNMYQFTHEWFFTFFRNMVQNYHFMRNENSSKVKERAINKLQR